MPLGKDLTQLQLNMKLQANSSQEPGFRPLAVSRTCKNVHSRHAWYVMRRLSSTPNTVIGLTLSTVSVFPTPTTTSSGTTGTAAAGQSNNDKIGNRIGLGVGIGIGLPSLIGALWSSWLTWRTYQLKRSKKSHKMPSSESPPASEVAVPASPHPQATPPDEHSTNTPSCESSQRLNILVSQP
jgi:hypothetical protein